MSLFDPDARARRTDPETSHAAARAQSGSTRVRVLDLFVDGAELSDDQVCALLPDLHPPTVKTARSWLWKDGQLEDTGRRTTSARGRDMIVWRRA